VLLSQAGEDMQRDYWYSSARDARDLESVADIGRKAGERAVARLGARKIATQKARVLYAPEVARGLIGHFLGAVRGSSQYRKSSFLLGAAGQQVFPSFLELRERPHIRKALGSSPFDGEGVATRDRELVQEGVLQGYVLGSYSARKLGLKTTGNAGGTHNLLVESKTGGTDISALMRALGTGLLVTELMGQGVNGVTGDYSRGAVGLWIENGEFAYPVEEVTVAGNLLEMFDRIDGIANDLVLRDRVAAPTVKIARMVVAGH
jgi:PmbA protein